MGLLSLKFLIFSPLIFPIFFMLPILRDSEVAVRRIAKSFAGLHFLYSICFWIFYNPDLTFFDELSIFGQSGIQSLGIRSAFAIDGLSLILIILSSFLVFIATIASKTCIKKRHKLYYGLLFLLETALIGVFASADMYMFFFFWELELIPMYFLINLWGSGNSQKSAMKFLIYTFAASMFLLIGILLLHYYNDTLNYQMSALFADVNVVDKLPINIQILISILLLIGFCVKLPIIPLHTWLPNAHVDAPAPVSVLLAGVLLKMGAYGVIKFNMMLLPDAFRLIAPVLMIIALVNIVYSAFVAYNQIDLKKIVAYSSISNMGIVLLGLSACNEIGAVGGIFHMVSHGLVSAGLFLIVGMIYIRTKTRDINLLGGLGTVMPTLMGFSILFMLASVGVPLLMGFVGEFLSFWGAFNSSLETKFFIPILVIFAMMVIVLSICYMLKFLQKTFYGQLSEVRYNFRDISAHEFVVLAALISVIIFFGLNPMSLIDIVKPFVVILIESVGL